MRVPEGSLCGNCVHYFWTDKAGITYVKCLALQGESTIWKRAADFVVDGITYDTPLVLECTQYEPK